MNNEKVQYLFRKPAKRIRNGDDKMSIVIIGKTTSSTEDDIQLEYPSIEGIRSIKIPRTCIGEFRKLTNDRVAVLFLNDNSHRGTHIERILSSDWAPLIVTQEQIEIAAAMEYGEDLPAVSIDDSYDDEVPMWSASAAPTVTVDGVVANAEGPFDAVFKTGGRAPKITDDWDFTPVRKPSFVMHGDEDNPTMGATVARVNSEKGEPVAYHIFNPKYETDKRPAGAYLGTFSASYYPMPYRKGFGPVLDLAAKEGWPAQVMAWDEGKKAACFCDVTSNIDWEQAESQLGDNWTHKGYKNNGDYRVGIAIYNSLDGSSSFKVQAIAERLVCTNGMVMGDRANLIKLKHTNGVLGNFDFDTMAEKIGEVIQAAAKEILVAEGMKDVKVDRDTFEKLMTICERKGLIKKPVLKRDDAGDVTGITRGHMWRLMGQGWTNPSEPWVAVNNEDAGSLYQVYNILTGALTHRPSWTDGTQVLNGATLNMNTVTDRLQSVHKILGDMTSKAMSGVSLDDQLKSVPMFSEVLY